jgi:ankyrin repeat protein
LLSACPVPLLGQRTARKPTKAALNGALLRAAERNRASEVRVLLANGANPNAKGPLGYTPIMLIALHPNPDTAIFQMLRRAGGSIDATDNAGTTALMHACANDLASEVSVLLAHGAKPNLTDPNGSTALMMAAEKGGEKIVPLLLAHGARVDLQNRTGQTALFLTTVAPAGHFALTRKFYLMRVHVMQMLLEKGANLNLPTRSGTTPLMMAAGNENTEMVEELLKRHADVKACDAQGMTALKLAMQHKSSEKILNLLKQASATE